MYAWEREKGRGRLACTACGPVKTNTKKIKGMSLWFGGFFEMSAAKGNRRLPQSIVRIKNSSSLLFSSVLWRWSKMIRVLGESGFYFVYFVGSFAEFLSPKMLMHQ